MGRCFSSVAGVTARDIEDGIRALAEADCIILLSVKGRPCLKIRNREDHPYIRNILFRYPGPDDVNGPADA